MAKDKEQIKDLAFYQYLGYFYSRNKKEIRRSYTGLSKKFLDYNDPANSDAYLRLPQFQALEIYIFLKEYLNNAFMHEIFRDWYKKTGKFVAREELKVYGDGQMGLFTEVDAKVFKAVFDNIKQFEQIYPNYIYALTMGLGKTVLMATSIFYEFLLANKYPQDKRYCHNALVFAPDKTVLQSLKEIQTFDKSKVVPPEYINWLDTNLHFHFLDDTGISLNTMDKSDYNIIISNTQKIILKKQHKEKTPGQLLFSDADKYQVIQSNEGYNDLYDFVAEDELELLSNQRFAKLTRLKQLGIYVDEAHHAFGNTLAKDFGLKKSATSLRLTINGLAQNLKDAGSKVVACYNYTGTPYVNNRLLPEVVYEYGLKKSINDKYLKQVKVSGFSNTKSIEFIRETIREFWSRHKGKRYENMLPKIAFFTRRVDELQTDLKPAVEKVLSELKIPLNKILVNVGDEKVTTNDDLREFINLDTPASEKQFILLVNKGKEGWNCRSLFAVGLHRKPKSTIFVLQATMRCLRSIGEIQETANVYLSDENLNILEHELQDNFRMSVKDMSTAGDKKKVVEVRVVPPPVIIKLKKISRLYKLNSKSLASEVDLKLETAPTDQYEIVRTDRDIRDISGKAGADRAITHIREKRLFSELTIIAEIARYLNIAPVKINEILKSTKQGIKKILDAVNEYNELLYDWVIPKLFNEMFEIEEFKSEIEEEIELVKQPSGDDGCYRVKAEEDLIASVSDDKYRAHKKKSFHLDNYCFDSKPENALFWSLINEEKIKKVYFTGMLRHGQTDFNIRYIDPESHTLRTYYPDFLTQKDGGSYEIIEVKGDNKIDDAVVQAKAYYANQMAVESGMSYRIVKGSVAMQGLIGETKSEQKEIELFDIDLSRIYVDMLPVYSMQAACSRFGDGEEIECDGWVEVKGMELNKEMFVCRAVGKSMEPKIVDGSYCIFRKIPAGTRQNKIVLVQMHNVEDPENGGKYTIKKYSSEKKQEEDGDWRHTKITLSPLNLNKDFKPIVFTPETSDINDDVRIVAELVKVIAVS